MSMEKRLLGTVREVWRYPVSSLAGERLRSIDFDRDGVIGDRRYAVVDAATGQPAAPEKEPRWRAALFLSSRTHDGQVEIGFPDKCWISLDHPDLLPRLRLHFGFDVAVHPYAVNGGCDTGVAVNRYTPSPLHLLTTASMEQLSALAQVEDVESRRFRPTVLLECSDGSGFIEESWIGQPLSIGAVSVHVTEATKRCGMTLIPQPGLTEAPEILRTILRRNRRNLGVYCSINKAGTISAGDYAYAEGKTGNDKE